MSTKVVDNNISNLRFPELDVCPSWRPAGYSSKILNKVYDDYLKSISTQDIFNLENIRINITSNSNQIYLPVIIWTSATTGRPRDGLHVYAPESEVCALVTKSCVKYKKFV
jgi:hypothetical protein